MTDHTPTDEQAAIVSAVTASEENILINALAGTGKTSTLELIEKATSACPILYLAFNKKVADEASEKFLSTTTVRTLNSFGHRIWAKTNANRLTLDPKKMQQLVKDLINELPKHLQREAWDCYFEVISGVSMAKAIGYVPSSKFPNARRLATREQFHARLEEQPSDLCADLIDEALILSIRTAYKGFVDYNDQLYMPALFGGTFPRFPLVMVDEKQDLSPVNYAMLDKLSRNRIIGVGDPWQSIYGFRGAKQGGMAEAKTKYSMREMDLSISFRCPQAVVEHVHWRVPHFKWTKPGGKVIDVKFTVTPDFFKEGAAIICRNNAPLFSMAMRLLSAGRSVSVAGSEIGPKIVGIMRKLGDETMPKASLLSAIEDWREEKLVKQSTTANDIADCMVVFADFGSNLGQAVSYAEHLFKQKGSLRLLTGHKAKGLEFETVYHLDPWLIGQGEQELNLRYVISTRAKQELYEIDSKSIRW